MGPTISSDLIFIQRHLNSRNQGTLSSEKGKKREEPGNEDVKLYIYWVANRQTQSRSVFDFVFFLFFFSMSGKVLPISPLLSGVFVYRVFCAYFVSFEGTGVMCRFPW